MFAPELTPSNTHLLWYQYKVRGDHFIKTEGKGQALKKFKVTKTKREQTTMCIYNDGDIIRTM
jgi:hypothetical protein